MSNGWPRASGERIDALLAGASGSLVFGVDSTAKYLAPSIVAAFQRESPGVRVTLAVGNRERHHRRGWSATNST